MREAWQHHWVSKGSCNLWLSFFESKSAIWKTLLSCHSRPSSDGKSLNRIRKTCVDHIHFSITVWHRFGVLRTRCCETLLLFDLEASKKSIIVWSTWNQYCRGPKYSIFSFFFNWGRRVIKSNFSNPRWNPTAQLYCSLNLNAPTLPTAATLAEHSVANLWCLTLLSFCTLQSVPLCLNKYVFLNHYNLGEVNALIEHLFETADIIVRQQNLYEVPPLISISSVWQ